MWREVGWIEVLVWKEGETWLGRGPNREQALNSALDQMLPSAAAREAWSLYIGRWDRTVVPRDEPVGSFDHGQAEEQPDVAPVEPGATAPEPRAAVVRPERPVQRDGLSVEMAELARGLDKIAAEVSEPAAGGEVGLYTAHDARAAIDEALEHLEESRENFAALSPRRMRLLILDAVATARDLEDRYPGDSVEQTASRVVGVLSEFARRWWPGSIVALNRKTRPSEAVQEALEYAGVGSPTREEEVKSWADVARVAEAVLGELEARESDAGYDDDGWRDAAELSPEPKEPRGLHGHVWTWLEANTGPRKKRDAQGSEDKVKLLANDHDLQRQIEHVAIHTRWLRWALDDPVEWADTMGRLRWVAARLNTYNKKVATRLSRLLSEDYRPRESWYKQLKGDGTRERRQERRELYGLLHRYDPGQTPDSDLVAWLARAFPVFTNPELARLLAPSWEQRIRNLDAGECFDEAHRGPRRRLRKLQDEIKRLPSGEAPGFELEDEATSVDGLADEALIEPASEQARGPDQVCPLVRSHTEGKRILFVSNRRDEHLRRRLMELFGFGEVDWSEGDIRELQSKQEAISNHTYDMVLVATGFQSHMVDSVLNSACSKARVKYVRVNRGRPAAVCRALKRDLGLS